MTATPIIELDQATVIRDGRRALDRASLTVAPGQHTVILGPNGSGKSTLVQLVHRKLYPLARNDADSAIRIFGHSRWNVAELRQRLGLVSADLHFELRRLAGLDVEDAVLSGFWASHGIPPRISPSLQQLAATNQALRRVGALELRRRRLETLSAGEARRALIARALVHEPEALLLDEPTTGLDFVARHRFLQDLRQLAQTGVTLILVTHHLEEILPETRQVVLLSGGRVLAAGTPDAVLRSELLTQVWDFPLVVERDAGGLFRLRLEFPG